MPIFEYKCKLCGNVFERLVNSSKPSIGDDVRGIACAHIETCPKCLGDSFKQMTVSSFRIKGYSEANGYSKK